MEAPVEIGQVIAGKYVVERLLARGGAGVVVKAKHLQLLEPCAIKFMLPRAGATPLARERFLREARACARLKGDHVVRVFDVGEFDGGLDEGTPYMVLEYLEGTDLEERLAQQKPLPVAEAVGHVIQVCAGLSEAHALGIVHRDLKPANVFLSRLADGSTRVKLLDFGISKDLFDAPGDQARTEDGILVGSPLFMAPEQVRADEIDTRADLWAVGVILYYLVTGAFPFEGQKASDTMAHILTRAPAPPSRHLPEIPPALERLIMQCLEKDPARRPPTADDLALQLSAFAEDGTPLGFTSILPRRRRRARWILPAAVAGVALAVVAIALAVPALEPSASSAAASASAGTDGAGALVPVVPATVTAPPAVAVTAPVPSASASASPTAPPPTRPATPPLRTAPTTPASPASARRRPTSGEPSRGFDLGSRH